MNISNDIKNELDTLLNKETLTDSQRNEYRDIIKNQYKNLTYTIKDEKVEVILNTTIKEVIGDENHITEIILNDDRKIKADAIFVCIGKELSSAYYQNLNIKTDNLGIIVDKDMKTSNSSIYAAGDVISKSLYQVVTATGEGALAASSIIKSLKK